MSAGTGGESGQDEADERASLRGALWSRVELKKTWYSVIIETRKEKANKVEKKEKKREDEITSPWKPFMTDINWEQYRKHLSLSELNFWRFYYPLYFSYKVFREAASFFFFIILRTNNHSLSLKAYRNPSPSPSTSDSWFISALCKTFPEKTYI